jgi:cytidylate kinase
MTVIAMTREMGSLGKDVAAALAEQMGLKVVHHELVERDIAARLGVNDSTVHQYLEGSASLLERWKIDKQKLARFTAEEVLELAQQGNVVIRGWGATALLRDIPHVLLVRVCAPMAFRQRVMMERLAIGDVSIARREIERSDAAHAGIVQGFFGVDWQDPVLYHVVLNAERVPIETCVKIVRMLAESPAFQETEAARSALSDKLTESRVRAALGDHVGIGMGVSVVDVAVAQGKVTLTGTAIHSQLRADLETVVRGIAGVKGIVNNVVVLRGYSGSV